MNKVKSRTSISLLETSKMRSSLKMAVFLVFTLRTLKSTKNILFVWQIEEFQSMFRHRMVWNALWPVGRCNQWPTRLLFCQQTAVDQTPWTPVSTAGGSWRHSNIWTWIWAFPAPLGWTFQQMLDMLLLPTSSSLIPEPINKLLLCFSFFVPSYERTSKRTAAYAPDTAMRISTYYFVFRTYYIVFRGHLLLSVLLHYPATASIIRRPQMASVQESMEYSVMCFHTKGNWFFLLRYGLFMCNTERYYCTDFQFSCSVHYFWCWNVETVWELDFRMLLAFDFRIVFFSGGILFLHFQICWYLVLLCYLNITAVVRRSLKFRLHFFWLFSNL